MDFRASEFLIPIFDFDILNMQLNTPLFIFVLVLTVMFLMNRLLFQPVLKTMELRQGFLSGLEEKAASQREEIRRLSEEYDARLEKMRAEVAQVRADARRESQETIDGILHQARQEAEAELRGALAELEREVEQARGGLSDVAPGLAEKAAERILSA